MGHFLTKQWAAYTVGLVSYSRNIFSGFMLNSIPLLWWSVYVSGLQCMSQFLVFPDFTEEGSKVLLLVREVMHIGQLLCDCCQGHLPSHGIYTAIEADLTLSLLCVTKSIVPPILAVLSFSLVTFFFFFFADFVIPKMQETSTPSWWLVLWWSLLFPCSLESYSQQYIVFCSV